ncbi:MAG: alpha/beta hydrolase [Deltaproteobacteria bacterium]|jgi:predicted alpha/beta-hydrolase family hydrolase|nr:alpha/beta hydrolase [Deltaproteobacteria bacterium]
MSVPPPELLHDDADGAIARLVLAHGAGAPMDHAWMNAMTERLVARGISVTRFEFPFMAARRAGGKRSPAPRAEKLTGNYAAAIAAVRTERASDKLFIGGKSLGGRVASLIADEEYAAGRIAGLVCLGYPFHPPKKPEKLRTAHLARLDCPALIIQGTRDPLGSREELSGYGLDKRIGIVWLEDGDHDLKPRKRSGETFDGHLDAAADAIRGFVEAR